MQKREYFLFNGQPFFKYPGISGKTNTPQGGRAVGQALLAPAGPAARQRGRRPRDGAPPWGGLVLPEYKRLIECGAL